MKAVIASATILFSSDKALYRSLKNILGFYPKNISLYKQAFRHSSASQEIKEGVRDSNERLEYLGDAILSAAVADYLFKTFPYKDEGFLTKMRSKVVSRTQLNQLAVKLGIEKYMEKNVDRNNTNSSILGDAFEALIGAIYLDFGYIKAHHFIMKRIIKPHIDIYELETKETDFKSKLLEWVQKERKVLSFKLLESAGQDNSRQYLVQAMIDDTAYAKGQHFSKKKAEQIASELTCNELGI